MRGPPMTGWDGVIGVMGVVAPKGALDPVDEFPRPLLKGVVPIDGVVPMGGVVPMSGVVPMNGVVPMSGVVPMNGVVPITPLFSEGETPMPLPMKLFGVVPITLGVVPITPGVVPITPGVAPMIPGVVPMIPGVVPIAPPVPAPTAGAGAGLGATWLKEAVDKAKSVAAVADAKSFRSNIAESPLL